MQQIPQYQLVNRSVSTDTPVSIGQTLEGVSEFQYLVSIISTNLDVEVDIRAKIGKAASTFQRLCKIWSSHSINLDTKLRLYMSIVIPTALHACETWKSTSIIRQKLHVFHQRCLRTILGISWCDHITNDEVCEKLISEAYLRLCNKGGWDLWDILRLPENRPAYMAMNWQAGGQHSVRTYMIWDLLGWVQRDLPATHRNGESSSPIVPAGTGGSKVR